MNIFEKYTKRSKELKTLIDSSVDEQIASKYVAELECLKSNKNQYFIDNPMYEGIEGISDSIKKFNKIFKMSDADKRIELAKIAEEDLAKKDFSSMYEIVISPKNTKML